MSAVSDRWSGTTPRLGADLTRRRALGLAGWGAVALGLSGCAGMGGPTEDQEHDGPLQFWSNHPGTSKALELEIIDRWNRENPDTPAQLVDAGLNYEDVAQKFNAALAGGLLPDVLVASDVTWFNFAFQGATAPLDELWEEEGIDPSTYVDSLMADYEYEGRHYGVPYSRSTALMYLNSEVLQKAGLPTDRGPENWEEFAEWAPRMVEANNGKPALAMSNGSNYLDWYFQGMLWALGGRYSEDWDLRFTDPKTIAAGKFLQEQVAQGHISVVPDGANEFGIGNAAAVLESTGSLSGIKDTAGFDFVTTFLPGPGPSCPTGGAGLAVPAGISRRRRRIAARFVDFMTNMENTIYFTQQTGYMPVRQGADEVPEQRDYLEENPNARTAARQLEENTRPQDFARVSVSGGGLQIGGALDRITTGGEDVERVFADLQEKLQRIIDRDIVPYQ